MWKGLREFHGISKEIIEIFAKLCPECELKKGTPKKGIVIRPILTQEQNERCQVDLIDLQSVPDGKYKFLMVKEPVNRWPNRKIVHGKPRHSQSQGSVERANQDVEKILCIQLREEKSTRWARFIPMVQSMKNRRLHRGIGRSPFEAMFGRNLAVWSFGRLDVRMEQFQQMRKGGKDCK